MWGWLASLIGGPVVSGLLNAYKAKLDAGNTADRIAADLAARELAVEAREAEIEAQVKIDAHGHWYAVENLFAYVLLGFFAKIYLFDAAFHLGSTDAVRGDAANWANLIIVFWFGKRGVENALRIWTRK